MRARATVLKWNRASGYGFLNPIDDPESDVFVHISAIQGARRLIEGQEVEFEYGEYNGKPTARNVVVVGGVQ